MMHPDPPSGPSLATSAQRAAVPLVLACTLVTLLACLPLPAMAYVDPETGRWRPGIGDPTIYGWVTVLAYLSAAIVLLANVRLAGRLSQGRQFWIAVGLLMLAMAINKQLDLQTWFTQVGRDAALAQGWYDTRRTVQAAFIAILSLSAVLVALLMRRWIGSAWDQYRLCAIGVVVTFTFVIVRATTFHYVDRMLGFSFSGMRINVWLEIGGIALVLAGALTWRRSALARERALAALRPAARRAG
ncbi:MAG: hypothetical protein JJU27_11645 [Gammaproteobacteria bacterium]|nr:hypothetical protein [Gammaproteobacteria bacterium]